MDTDLGEKVDGRYAYVAVSTCPGAYLFIFMSNTEALYMVL